MSINHTQKHASLTSPDSGVRYNRQPAIFDGLLLDKVQLMKQNNESITPLRKYIAIGYALIALLIGGIVFIYLGEWRELERIEAESKEVNMLRQKVHDAYAQMLDRQTRKTYILFCDFVPYFCVINGTFCYLFGMIIKRDPPAVLTGC